MDDDPYKSLNVLCPDGKLVLSGGAFLGGAIGSLGTSATGPTGPKSDPEAWLGRGLDIFNSGNRWAMRVDAICGNVAGY